MDGKNFLIKAENPKLPIGGIFLSKFNRKGK